MVNKQELIEEIEDLKDLKELFGNDPNYIEIDTVIRLISKLDEPQPLKLKDVIKRIEGLNLGTQKVWLDEILNELGSDYGTLKYKDGYGQGKLEGEWVGQQLKDADKIRQELNKPVIPQFVADWYEEHKDNLEYNIWDWMKYNLEPKKRENVIFSRWLGKTVNNPVETLIKMKLYGYEVEKENRYEVILCNGQSLKTVYRQGNDRLDFEKVYGDLETFTRKELEEANLGWVFDCPGVEVWEVEE